MTFSIIIPAFNEEKNISILINEIYATLSNSYEFEIIVVDDCSTDNTNEELRSISNDKKIIIIRNEKNSGQSYSLLQGIKKSTYDTIISIDADLQNNPRDIPKLIELFITDKNIGLVGGIRNNRRDTKIKIITSKIANYVRRNVLADDCSDTGCSLKVFKRKYFLSIPYFNGLHRFLPAFFKAMGCKTKFLNVDHRQRVNGISKYNTLNRLFRGCRDLWKVYFIIKKLKNEKIR